MQILDKIRKSELQGKLIEARERQDEKAARIKEVGEKVAALDKIIKRERDAKVAKTEEVVVDPSELEDRLSELVTKGSHEEWDIFRKVK